MTHLDTFDKVDDRECDAMVDPDDGGPGAGHPNEVPCGFKGEVGIDFWDGPGEPGARWTCPKCGTETEEDPREWYV